MAALVVLPYRLEEDSDERLVVHALAADARLELSPGFKVFLDAFAVPTTPEAFVEKHAALAEREELEAGIAALVERGLLVDAAVRDALKDLRFERAAHAAFGFERAPVTALLAGQADAVFVGFPVDIATTGAAGARGGPAAIRFHTQRRSLEAGRWLDEGSETVRVLPALRALDVGDLVLRPGEGIDAVLPRIETTAALAAATGAVVVAAGGDHSVTYPLVRGLVKARRQAGARGLCIVHFDAHSDLPRAAFSPFDAMHSHASFMRHVIDDGLVERVVQIGLRDVVAAPRADDPALRVEPAVVGARRAMTLERAALLALVPDDLDLYVTIDTDVIDPAFAAETGTPLSCGLPPWRLFEMVTALCEERRLAGIDVVEVAGDASAKNRAAALAAHLLHHALLRRFSEVER